MNYVYKITCIPNGKLYIGITSKTPEIRWKTHCQTAYSPNNKDYNALLKKAIRKYGKDNFLIETIETTESFEKAKELEIKYIKEFNTYAFDENSNGYNSTRGGDGNFELMCKQVVQVQIIPFEILKIYPSVKEAINEHCRGISESCNNKTYFTSNPQGNVYANGYTWFFYDEVKDLTKEELLNITYLKCDIIVQLTLDGNIVNYWKGPLEAAEFYQISQGDISACLCHKRRKCLEFQWIYYKDFIKKDNNKIEPIKKYCKSVIQYDLYGNFIKTHSSITEAANVLGLIDSKISSVCKKKRNQTGNYIWRYINDPISPNEKEQILNNINLKQLKQKEKELKRENISYKSAVCKSIKNLETGEVFDSLSAASDKYHCARKSLRKACEDQDYLCANYHWRYV